TNTSSNAIDFGVPGASIAGFTSVGRVNSNPNASTDEDYQLVDNLSIVHGRHNLKLGLNYIYEKFFTRTDTFGIPGVTFDGRYTHASLGDFLLGNPISGSASVGDGSQNIRQNNFAGYIQDDLRLRPTLTLNLGIRYDYFQTPYDVNNKTVWFDPSIGNLVYSEDGGVRNGIVDPDYNNFAPRVGFSYSPGFLRNTVLRSAYGVFYGTDNWNELQFMVN